MKRFLRSSLLVLPLLAAPLVQAEPKAKAPRTAIPIDVPLPGGSADRAIGVEPEGGRFEEVLPAHAVVGEKTLQTISRNQDASTLAIYAIGENASRLMHDEKPLARLKLSGPGRSGDVVWVKFTQKSNAHLLTVEARASSRTGPPLKVDLLTAKDLGLATFTRRSKNPELPGIGSGPATPARLVQPIGVRTAGGLVKPLLTIPARAQPDAVTGYYYYIWTRYPDQKTADASVFTADNPYIEKDQLFGRYLLSGIPAGEKRRIRLDFPVGRNGKTDTMPTATDTLSGQRIKVKRYSEWTAEQLAEPPRDQQPTKGGIPASPPVG